MRDHECDGWFRGCNICLDAILADYRRRTADVSLFTTLSPTTQNQTWLLEFANGYTMEYTGGAGACYAVWRNNLSIVSAVRLL